MMIELPSAVKTESKERKKIMNTNTKKRALAFLMALAMMVMLAACGGKNPAGTYELSKMGDGSMEMTAEELSAIYGRELDVTLELTEDNQFTLHMGIMADGEGEAYSGTWELDGDALILNVEGEEASCTYDGKTIVMDMENVILTFAKQ